MRTIRTLNLTITGISKHSISMLLFILLAVFFAGCLNLEQKTVLKQDGSGTMKIHYWSKISNLNISKDIGGFSFDESRARQNFSSPNTEIINSKLEENMNDSTSHMNVELKFKDINQLSSAAGFKTVRVSWKETGGGMEFSYTIPEDSSNSHNVYVKSSKLIYEVEFPAEVKETNGTKNGNKVVWNRTIADLKTDLVMTAIVEKEGRSCGLFGVEFPLLALAGIIMISIKAKKKK